jgi:hypothetical protein
MKIASKLSEGVSFLKLLEKALSDQFVQETDVSVIGTI